VLIFCHHLLPRPRIESTSQQGVRVVQRVTCRKFIPAMQVQLLPEVTHRPPATTKDHLESIFNERSFKRQTLKLINKKTLDLSSKSGALDHLTVDPISELFFGSPKRIQVDKLQQLNIFTAAFILLQLQREACMGPLGRDTNVYQCSLTLYNHSP